MDWVSKFKKLFNSKAGRWLLVLGLVAVTHLLFQFLLLPYGQALQSLLPDKEVLNLDDSSRFVMVRNTLTVNDSDFSGHDISDRFVKSGDDSEAGVDIEVGNGVRVVDMDIKNDTSIDEEDQDYVVELVTDRDVGDDFSLDNVKDYQESVVNSGQNGENGSILELANEARLDIPLERVEERKRKEELPTENITQQHTGKLPNSFGDVEVASSTVPQLANISNLRTEWSKTNTFVNSSVLPTNAFSSENASAQIGSHVKKKMRSEMPPKSITLINEMNSILLRHRRSSRAMVSCFMYVQQVIR